MNPSLRKLDLRVLQLSEKIGLPSEPVYRLIRARRVAGQLGDWFARRGKAKEIRASSPYANLIDRRKGYYRFDKSLLPEISAAVAEAAELFEAKQASLSVADSKKPFFANIMTATDVENCNRIMALAEHAAMFEASAAYLGTFPKLRSVGIYVSEKNDSQISSQMFHFDNNDLNQIKCFINVNDVGPHNGPFTFLSADKSRALGLPWRAGRVEDQDVFSRVREEDLVSLTGPPGTGAFVDTSRCLHYGSRCREGRRIVLMIQYTPHPDLSMKMEKYSRKGMPVLVSDGHT
jgi:hypothetical protein